MTACITRKSISPYSYTLIVTVRLVFIIQCSRRISRKWRGTILPIIIRTLSLALVSRVCFVIPLQITCLLENFQQAKSGTTLSIRSLLYKRLIESDYPWLCFSGSQEEMFSTSRIGSREYVFFLSSWSSVYHILMTSTISHCLDYN